VNGKQAIIDSTQKPRFRFRFAVRIVLGVLAALGIWRAIVSSMQVSAVRVELDRLAKTLGYITVKDPKKVYVLALPTEGKNIWRFRLYLPANYEWSESHYSGRISATTPRLTGGSGGRGWSAGRTEPVDFLLTIGCFKEPQGWELHTSSYNSRGSVGLGNNALSQLLENPESLVVECVGQNGPAEFAVDEPVCLLRFRAPEPVADHDSDDPLYEGFYFYVVPKPALGGFESAQQGN
jgi:hypothetical protein